MFRHANWLKSRGATLTGYGLVVGLIAIVGLVAVTSTGSNVKSLFEDVGVTLTEVVDGTVGQNTPQQPTGPTAIQLVDRGDGIRRWADGTAAATCADYRSPATGYEYAGATGDGLYQISSSPYAADHVYCDMTLDDGGWQAFFRGTNGAANIFAQFELTAESCADVETQCLRRLPAGVSTADRFLARCGGTAISFTASPGVLNLFANGTQNNWQPITSVSTELGNPAYPYDHVWTGSGNNRSFIIAALATGNQTLLSSYNFNTGWDLCNHSADNSTEIALYFRAGDFALPPDPNSISLVDRGDGVREWADGTAEASCADYRDPPSGYAYSGLTGNGLYRITPSPYASDIVYCEMGIDGGGWQAFFRGTNGSPNVFA